MAIKGDCKITLEEVEEKKESKGKGALAAVSDCVTQLMLYTGEKLSSPIF